MRTFSILCVAFLYYVNTASAQTFTSWAPMKNDSLPLTLVQKQINEKFLADSLALSGTNKKYILEVYRDRKEFLADMFGDKSFFSNPTISGYLSALTDRILLANPELKALNPRFLLSRDYIPNAFSTGEGTIVFNTGLFVKLANESQVIFVLCHELAHLYLDHSNKGINDYISSVYSAEFQKLLKEIKRQKYERNKELDQMEKKLAFSFMRHSRKQETEADSMGLVFMKKTSFAIGESLASLRILDSIDNDTYKTEKELPTVFNFSEHPFQSRWLRKESGFFGVTTDTKEKSKDADSLKTHPDCKLRIVMLEPAVTPAIKNISPNLIDGHLFSEMQKDLRFEEVQFCYDSKKITRCLYLALELHKENPTNIYPVTMIGKCMNMMYEKQKEHRLTEIAALPSPYREKNYNSLLEFIQQIRLPDIAALSYFFLTQYSSAPGADAGFAAELNKARVNYNIH